MYVTINQYKFKPVHFREQRAQRGMRRVLLVLLGLAQVGALSALFRDTQYDFCCHDDMCSLNFELSGCSSEYERSRFDYMLDSLMRDLHQEPSWFDESPVPLQSLLRHHRFCLGSEIMELGRGCQCRHDRRCNVREPADLRLAPWILDLLVLLAAGFILFFGIRVLRRQKQLEKRLGPGVMASQFTTLDEILS